MFWRALYRARGSRCTGLREREREREREMEQIIVKPPRDMCSKSTENCASTKCCQVTGYNCFYKKQGVAACMKSCTPGKDGITVNYC